jgi:hypothetical protein
MPFFKKIMSFCHKSLLNRVAEILRLLHKDSSRPGAHMTCQETKKKFWHHVDKDVTNIEKMPIFKKITSFCH